MNMNYKYSTLALAIVALLTGCGAEDNKDISGDNDNIYAPIIKGDVTIPALHVGYTAKGAYQYFDPNPVARPEGESLYSWRDANEAELGTEQSLTLTYEMLGENVKFCVKPVAQGTVSPVGDEECSDPRIVEETLGEKPVADNVVLDNTAPTVGDTLTGSYDYSHPDDTPQGNSSFVWYAGDLKIAGEENQTLVLMPQNSEGKKIKFCVLPETNDAVPVRGDEVCSAPTDDVVMDPNNVAPVAVVSGVDGQAVEGAVLTGQYTWSDADNDVKTASVYSWKRGTDIIADETSISYSTVSADVGEVISFCVQPFASTGVLTGGENVCHEMAEAIAPNAETPPTADPATIEVVSGGAFEVGEELLGKYTYNQAEGVEEGDSTALWKVGTDNVVCEEGKADNCNYTLKNSDLGKDIQFCVTPVTANKKPGDESCSPAGVQPMGIKISGSLQYDSELTAVVYGYAEGAATGEWKIDVSNQNGAEASANDNPTVQFTGVTYKIGVREGTLTDLAWVERGDGLDARNFIGKDVQYCLDTASGEKCVNPADYSDVDGGLYVDANDATKRTIEPIRTYQFGTATYHRPLTVAESKLKAQADFGTSIPSAVNSTTINGIEWALFAHDESGQKDVLNVCRNLYADSGEWHLPIGYLASSSSYKNNMYSAEEGFDNNPPTVGADSLNNLAKKVISSTYNSKDAATAPAKDIYMSRVFGWPTSTDNTKATDTTPRVTYASATKYIDGKNIGKTYIIRMYNIGSSTGNAGIDVPLFVSCVK